MRCHHSCNQGRDCTCAKHDEYDPLPHVCITLVIVVVAFGVGSLILDMIHLIPGAR